MDMIQRLLAATRAGSGELTIGPATVRAPLVRYQAEEEPDVRDLYLHTYPAKTAIPLCDSDEWAKFARWAATHDDCRELNRFTEDGCTDPNGDNVRGLQKDIRTALDRVDDSEGIGEMVHRVGKEIMDAAGETVEGLVVSDMSETT